MDSDPEFMKQMAGMLWRAGAGGFCGFKGRPSLSWCGGDNLGSNDMEEYRLNSQLPRNGGLVYSCT